MKTVMNRTSPYYILGKKLNMDNQKFNITLYGIITPSKWSVKGRVIGISLNTFKEDVYQIVRDKIFKQLLSCINRQVRLEGVIINKKKFTFQVQKYEIID